MLVTNPEKRRLYEDLVREWSELAKQADKLDEGETTSNRLGP
jgi:hypothetical protein